VGLTRELQGLLLTAGVLLMVTAVSVSTSLTARATGIPPRADVAGPVITSHLDGQQVSGEIEVTVNSSAPAVLIAWGAEVETGWVDLVSSNEGTATTLLTTSGYHGPTSIVARECTSDGVCQGAQTAVQVNVENPPPAFDQRVWHDVVYGEYGLIKIMEEGSWAWYGFFFDGEYVPPVVGESFFPAGADYLGDGHHTVQVAHCSQLSREMAFDPPVCDMENASEIRSFSMFSELHPIITDVQPRVISPDGNGIADAASVSLTVEAPHRLHWGLIRGAVTVARGVEVRDEAGPYTFTVDGLDANGRPLPSGTYDLKLFAYVPNTQVHGVTSTTLTVDGDAPAVTDLSATPRIFYPRRDGYRDSVHITANLSESTSRSRVRLVRDGIVVRRLWLGPQPQGPISATWDGRTAHGRVMKPAEYTYEFVARDLAGNRSVSRGGRIVLRRGS
jgi:hypothetical protein